MALAVLFDSVGFGEWFVLLAVVLVVVGPKRLPSAARTFGQYYSRFRRAAENFKRQLMDMDTELTRAVHEETAPVADAFTPDDGQCAPQDLTSAGAAGTSQSPGAEKPAEAT